MAQPPKRLIRVKRARQDEAGAETRADPPKRSGALAAPKDLAQMLTFRAPDYRAMMASWQDDVVRRRGIGIYEEMLYDPQVSSSLDLLKFAILSRGHSVSPPAGYEEDPEALKATELAKRHIATFPGGFKHYLYDSLSMLDYGYGIIELLWEAGTEWRVRRHVSLPPALYGFQLSDEGEITGVTYMTPLSKGQEVFPLDHFMILRWQPRFEGPYGRSQLRRAYEAWWMKQLVRRMRNTALDRFGSPFVVFKVPKGTPKSDRRVLKGILENLSAEAGAVLDEDYQLDELSGAGAGAAAGFQEALSYEDAQIAKAITGVVLNANESQGPGTYAQSQVHQDNFLYYVEYGGDVLAEAVTSQYLHKLCGYNLGTPPEKMPVFSFEPIRQDNLQLLISALQYAGQAGLVAPEEEFGWIRDRLGFQAASEEAAGIIKQRAGQLADNAVQMGAPQPEAAPEEEEPDDPSKSPLPSYGGGDDEDLPDDERYGQWLRGFVESSPLFGGRQ